MSLPDFNQLMSIAREQTRPYRWLVKQSKCRCCGNVHEMLPVLMKERASGWWIACDDDGSHEGAPVSIEHVQLQWCERCNSKAAQLLTKQVREALDLYANSRTLSVRLQRALREFELAEQKQQFHHA